jgi:hypothetical protein
MKDVLRVGICACIMRKEKNSINMRKGRTNFPLFPCTLFCGGTMRQL